MSTLSARARTVVITIVLLAFVAGVAAGVAAVRWLNPSPTIRANLDMSSVLDRLELSTEQRRAADSILARSAPQSRAVMLEMAGRLGAVADSVDAQLRTILTAEQRERLDAMRRDRRMMLKRRVPGGTRVDTIVDTTLRR